MAEVILVIGGSAQVPTPTTRNPAVPPRSPAAPCGGSSGRHICRPQRSGTLRYLLGRLWRPAGVPRGGACTDPRTGACTRPNSARERPVVCGADLVEQRAERALGDRGLE